MLILLFRSDCVTATNMEQREAEKLFSSTDDLIFLKNNTWVPVEITLAKGGSMKAWRSGSRASRPGSLYSLSNCRA